MAFLNSGILFLSFLGIIPIIIHFINRKKAINLPFGAFDFILKSRIVSNNNIKLRSILLLLLRIIIILLIIFIASLPFITGDSFSKGENNRVTWILFDNSLSQNCKDSIGSGMFKGYRYIKKIAETNRDREFKLVLSTEPKFIKSIDFTQNQNLEKLIPATYLAGNIKVALNRILSNIKSYSENFNLIIISDFQESSWSNINDSIFVNFTDGNKITLVSTNSLNFINYSVDSLNLKNGDIPGNIILNAKLNNYSNITSENIFVKFISSMDKLTSISDILLNSKTNILFTPQTQTCLTRGKLVISKDSLIEDNITYTVLPGLSKARVLIADGEMQEHYMQAESYFLQNALLTVFKENPIVIPASGLNKKLLKKCDILFLINPNFDNQQVLIIKQFLKKGGKLFTSLGTKTDINDFNKKFGSIYKREIRSLKTFQKDHPSYLNSGTMADKGITILNSVSNNTDYEFRKIFLLKVASSKFMKPLLRLNSGEPVLLSDKKYSKLLYLSSMDLDWNEFALRPYFLPYIQELIQRMVLGGNIKQGDKLYTGDTIKVTFKDKKVATFYNPSGTKSIIEVKNNVASFVNTQTPGIYKIDDTADSLFAVNTPPSESKNKIILNSKLDKIFIGPSLIKVSASNKEAEMSISKPLYKWLIILLLILLLLESIIKKGKQLKTKESL